MHRSFKTKGNLTKHTKSKAHYKKCVELGVVPVPTTVCDENADREAMGAQSTAGGGNAADESSEEEEESDGEESEESGSEEQEAAQSLLSLSQRNNRLPGLLPSGRPTTYPYALTLPTSPTTSTTTVASTAASTSAISVTNLIQSELSQRYYFPSNRAEESARSSVIIQSKKDDVEIEEIADMSGESRHHQSMSQPMDLTTKQTAQPPIQQRVARPADILTPVSEPVLMQTIVQTMERLPIQGREWKPDAQGHMLQAYLTERYVMDSKIKLQYRVGNNKLDKQAQERDVYPRHQDPGARSRHVEINGVPTVTYTDPSKMQLTESRVKHATKHTSDDIKMEIREKIYQNNMERRAFDLEAAHKEQPNRLLAERDSFELVLAATRPSIGGLPANKSSGSMDRPIYPVDAPPVLSTIDSPKSLTMDNRLMQQHIDVDRGSMFNAIKMMGEMDRPRECHPVNQEMRAASNDAVRMQSPRNLELRPPSREVRTTPGQEYRAQNQEPRLPSQQELKMPRGGQEMSREFTHEMQVIQELMPSANMEMRQTSSDNRPPSRDTRALSEYRDLRPSYEMMPMHEPPPPPKSQNVDARNTAVVYHYETKHSAEAIKQNNMPDNTKQHPVARKIVVGGPDFRSPSPNTAKPQAEFLQPSSGPAPNYVT